MKSSAVLPLWLAACQLLSSFVLYAQVASRDVRVLTTAAFAERGSGNLMVRLRDADTGFAVAPTEIRVVERATPLAPQRLTLAPLDQSNYVVLRLPQSGVRLTVSASGYREVRSDLTPPVAGIQKIDLWVERTPRDRRVSLERLRALRTPGRMVIVGFVGDEPAANPLPEVEVRTDRGHAVLADASGFYQLEIPVSGDSVFRPESITLFFGYPGYKTEAVEDVEIWSGGAIVLNVAMQPGEGARKHPRRGPFGSARPHDQPPPFALQAEPQGVTGRNLGATQVAEAILQLPEQITVCASSEVFDLKPTSVAPGNSVESRSCRVYRNC